MKAPVILYLLTLGFGVSTYAVVEVYDYPDVIVRGDLGEHSRSKLFKVTLSQGGNDYSPYVMYDRNQEPHGNLALNPDNHWTNFSFSGAITIRITRLDGQDFEWCRALPSAKGFHVDLDGAKAIIRIPEQVNPLQLFIEMNDMKRDALLIFADPLETDASDGASEDTAVISPGESIDSVIEKMTGDKTTVVFEKGIHRWGDKTGNDYAGYKLPIVSGKRIYIPGGAYVVGTFSGLNQSDWKLYGRGVISACGLERIPQIAGIPFSMVHADGVEAEGQVIEGIVSICRPHFNITVRGEVFIDNVKMLSWWHQTDGTVTGNNSVVRNCFFKVCDDVIKIYSDNCIHDNNTIFHQVNGAPFQFSWGGQHGDHNVSTNTYIVNSIYKPQKEFSNSAVINAMGGRPGNVTENNRWDGIFIDNGCHRLIGLNAKGGTHRDFEIKNVVLNSGTNVRPQENFSYLTNGDYSSIRFYNLVVDGERIGGTNPEEDLPGKGLLWFRNENLSAVSFSK